MPLVARLEHPGARAGGDDLVAQQRSERSLEHVGVLVLARVAVQRRGQGAWGERMVDDRESLARLGSLDLPGDAQAREVDVLAAVRRDRDAAGLHLSS